MSFTSRQLLQIILMGSLTCLDLTPDDSGGVDINKESVFLYSQRLRLGRSRQTMLV